MSTTNESPVARVRRFNRFWTKQIGLLDAGLLETEYSLTEARVIFELAQVDRLELVELRQRLGLDAGYLSRIIGRFRTDGLVETTPSPADARRQVLRLTDRGRAAFRVLDQRSAAQVKALLEPLAADDQRRLLGAMEAVEQVLMLRPAEEPYLIRGLEPGDLGWVVSRHGAIYAAEYGWDRTFEALVARIVADYVDHHDPQRENAWIAEVDGRPVGCVFCVKRDEEAAQLRILLVERSARGRGIGRRLVDECIRFARRTGYRRLVLWTNDVLVSARRIYEAAGFRLTREEPHRSFGHDLVGQYWELEL